MTDNTAHPELGVLRAQLHSILVASSGQSPLFFAPASLPPPILDATASAAAARSRSSGCERYGRGIMQTQLGLRGLKVFREAVRRDMEGIDKVSAGGGGGMTAAGLPHSRTQYTHVCFSSSRRTLIVPLPSLHFRPMLRTS